MVLSKVIGIGILAGIAALWYYWAMFLLTGFPTTWTPAIIGIIMLIPLWFLLNLVATFIGVIAAATLLALD